MIRIGLALTALAGLAACNGSGGQEQANAGGSTSTNVAASPLDSATNGSNESAAASSGTTLFECVLDDGKRVRVAAEGDRLTYTYGLNDDVEMMLPASAAQNNLFYMSQRFAGMQYQLRFANGDTSYILFSAEGNGNSGAQASSGLVVMRGTETIDNHACRQHAEFSADFDYSTLPQDTEDYSAM
jgi:hypothetical protein